MASSPEGRSSGWLIVAAGALTVALGTALALGWEPGVRGEWVWRRNTLPVRLWLPLGTGLVLATLAGVLCRAGRWEAMSRRGRAVSLAGLIACAFVFQVALLNSVGTPWVTPGAYIVSPNATTYFAVSLDVQDPARWVAGYPEQLFRLPYHAATHPPGLTLFFLLIRRATEALVRQPSPRLAELARDYSELFGLGLAPTDAAAAIASALVIALIGALGLVPLHYLARRLAGHGPAICATCLAAATPGILLLAASPDLIIMTLAVAALALACAAWQTGQRTLTVLASLVIAAGLFLSLAFALVAAWLLIWAVIGALGSEARWAALRRALRVALVGAGALTVAHVGAYYLCGYRPLAIAVRAISAHRAETTVEFARTYWKWLLMNPVEAAIFAGLPIGVGALWFAVGNRGGQGRLVAFLAAWLVLLGLLDLSGAVRGETGRIWLFLAWPAALATGTAVSARPEPGKTTALLVLLQVAQTLMMKGHLTLYSIL